MPQSFPEMTAGEAGVHVGNVTAEPEANAAPARRERAAQSSTGLSRRKPPAVWSKPARTPSPRSRSIRYGGPPGSSGARALDARSGHSVATGLGDYVGAGVIFLLLVFNAGLGLFQEGQAQATVDALKSRLALVAAVRRNDEWTTVPAAQLVPGDILKLSLGTVVAADVRLIDGSVLLDQSMLTGESVATEAGAGALAFAGALVRRGEAVAEVIATGERTKFGRTAELVRTAAVESSQQKTVLRVVRNLVLFNGAVTLCWAATRSRSRCRSVKSCRSYS